GAAELIVGIVPSINWIRVLRLASVVAPIMAGWFIIQLTDRNPRERYLLWIQDRSIIPIAIAILIISGMVAGIGGMY
ncbi:MAG: hypothetical protein ABEI86_00660, partial [Halobacteriaceae archaeon]